MMLIIYLSYSRWSGAAKFDLAYGRQNAKAIAVKCFCSLIIIVIKRKKP